MNYQSEGKMHDTDCVQQVLQQFWPCWSFIGFRNSSIKYDTIGFYRVQIISHKPDDSLLFLGRLARKNTFSSFSFPFTLVRGFLCGGDHCWMSSFGVFSVSRPPLQAGRLFHLVLRGLHKDPSKFSFSSWNGLHKNQGNIKQHHHFLLLKLYS